MKSINYINRSIEYLYYAIFLLVPLVFAGNTSELFEFNKMWLTFGTTALITSLWLSKMVLLKRVVFKRTVFDIPILIFLISQIVSTIISFDSYVSLWGYYSRWNGGLLSMISYIILYYAFVSNFFTQSEEKDYEKKSWIERNPTAVTVIKRSILISIISGLIVAFWSLPSHFGYDPTCLAFRGTFDVSCWTADFQPKVRIFGPLGQPDWLAGYMGVLLPIVLSLIIKTLRESKKYLNPYLIFYSVSFLLFYATLLYTGSRSGILASLISLFLMLVAYVFLNRRDLSFFKDKFLAVVLVGVILISFFARIQLPIFDKFSLDYVKEKVAAKTTKPNPAPTTTQTPANAGSPAISALDSGGSSSFEIRKIVWKGGLDAWKANPIFGTGVETYAFAYYKYRPIEHNNVSEWNFLYNKAHNEYINYLTTTGLFGFLSYMSFILLFIFIAVINLFNKKINPVRYLSSVSTPFTVEASDPMILALLTSFISILIINFFGFSVVILNIYLFLIPAFAILLLGLVKQDEVRSNKYIYVGYPQWATVGGLLFVAFVIIYVLIKYWIADTAYALGQNYDHAQQYQTAYPLLQKAVDERKEPVFEDELAVNKAVLALILAQQSQQQNSSDSAQVIQKLATESLATSDQLVKDHPHNIIFLKSRVRILYSLSNLDPRFLPAALEAIKATAQLAPTDASVLYNMGVLYGQNGDSLTASKVLEQTVKYKRNYRDAYYALALFYHDLGVDANTHKIKDPTYRQKAIDTLNYILTNLNPKDSQAIESLSAWQKEK